VSWWAKFLRDTRGNTTIVAAICMPVVVGSVGLGAETSYWQFKQRQMQTAVDMAAYTGAVSLRNNEAPQQARNEAAQEAVLHRFDPALGALTTNTPPTSGSSQNDRAMEVVLTQSMDRLFSAIFGDTPIIFEVRAVAAFEEQSDACILALSHEASAAVDFFGNSNVALINCEVMSNSIASDAVSLGGSTDVEAPCFNSVGGFEISGGSADYELTGCTAPRVDLPRALDPYADVPTPFLPSGCSNIPGGPPGNTTTVSAGAGGVKRFCNGLNLTGDYVFEPGVYIIDGGQFRAGGQANITGEGVTFYTTGGASIAFNGTAEINLTAPTTGDYAGLIFFGDRDDYGENHTFNGTADSTITGAIYMPAGDISFQGDFSGDNGCMQLVGNTVAFGGNANISTDCSGTGIDYAEVPGDVRLVE